eukprot:Gb_09712 [translate_table: standard]
MLGLAGVGWMVFKWELFALKLEPLTSEVIQCNRGGQVLTVPTEHDKGKCIEGPVVPSSPTSSPRSCDDEEATIGVDPYTTLTLHTGRPSLDKTSRILENRSPKSTLPEECVTKGSELQQQLDQAILFKLAK